MHTAIRRFCQLLAALIMAIPVVAAGVTQASANIHPCSVGVRSASKPVMSFGKDVPVILIHGIDGSPADWTSLRGSSICKDIDNLDGVRVALNFKYSGKLWGNIAKDFGPQIDKIAKQSVKNGGPGKVIVVGFSLGTAITRTAIETQKLGGKVGQVITIGAPNLNSWENYPKGVVVRAIGGDITNAIVKGKKTTYKHTKSDGLIGLSDAMKRYTNNPEIGGGRVTAQCTKTYSKRVNGKKLKPFNALCDHGNLLKNPIVRKGVLSGISAYADSIAVPAVRTWTVGQSLTVRLDDKWGEVVSATGETAEGYVEGYVGELGTNRKSLQIDSTSQYNSTDFDEQIFGSSSFMKTGAGPSVTIGGRTPDYSASFTENTIPVRYSNVWCFTDEAICVFYRGAYSLADAQPSAALKAVFSTATWSR